MTESAPTSLCLLRLRKDIKELHDHPLPGIFIFVDEKDMRVIHSLIVGPKDTPYEGAFFYLLLSIPFNYPVKPPDVKNMTTGEGRVMFNPNLYPQGKVCLSILGTFSGPGWSASHRLSSVLLAIQSLLNEKPLYNSPILEKRGISKEESEQYNFLIEHQALRVAVCDMVEGRTGDSNNLPQSLRDIMERQFLEFYDHYESLAKSRSHLNGKSFIDAMPYHKNKGRFSYTDILSRLERIKTSLEAKLGVARNSM